MGREGPEVLLVMLRYGNGVVGSLEIGAHLPRNFATESELVVECFCRQNVYHCTPENHAITVQGSRRQHVGWLPDQAADMVAGFLEMLRGGVAGRGAADDVRLLALVEEIRKSSKEDK
jgi:hypothetical protein